MNSLSVQELIDRAEAALRPTLVRDRWVADVAAAIESAAGNVYVGVCLDTGTTGFCAERAAGAAMLGAGESRVARVVAVWRDARVAPDSPLFVLPPCGTCRQFLYDLDPGNIAADVVVAADHVVSLGDLLPLHDWSARPAR